MQQLEEANCVVYMYLSSNSAQVHRVLDVRKVRWHIVLDWVNRLCEPEAAVLDTTNLWFAVSSSNNKQWQSST
jgi:hypothetical protein